MAKVDAGGAVSKLLLLLLDMDWSGRRTRNGQHSFRASSKFASHPDYQ